MILIAAVAMFDSRASALPDPTGKFPGGLGPGFYPFWSAAMIAGAAVVVIYRWYAPQLVEKWQVEYPAPLESSVLARLAEAAPEWPQAIVTP